MSSQQAEVKGESGSTKLKAQAQMSSQQAEAKLAELWPEGTIDNHEIRKAICRAKERKMVLTSEEEKGESGSTKLKAQAQMSSQQAEAKGELGSTKLKAQAHMSSQAEAKPSRAPDWFAKYENPKPGKAPESKNLVFMDVPNARKFRKIWELCYGKRTVVVCCMFGSDVDDVCSYLRTKMISTTKLHRGLHRSEQEDARRRFDQGLVRVLVATHDSFLKMAAAVRRTFEVINFDIPMYLDDYEKLVHIAEKTTTFINKSSSASFSLLKLVEYHKVPEFVKKLAKGGSK